MKKIALLLFMSLAYITLSAQVDYVKIDQKKPTADQKAPSIRGDVYPTDPFAGNSTTDSGERFTTLQEDVAVTTTTAPDYFEFTNTQNYWNVVGVRTLALDDWDIELHANTSFNNVLAYSNYGGTAVDFVVLDGNYCSSIVRGIKVTRYSGTGNAKVEFEAGWDVVSLGTTHSVSWPAGDVVEIYDVALEPGLHTFALNITSGMADLDFALYGSNGAEYFAGRSDYKAMSASNGSGGPEYFTYNVTTAGWYGLCVWACDGNSANYTLKVEKAGIWKGLVSSNWNTPGNWSGNMVPTSDVDVTIPPAPYSPIVSSGYAYCKSLEIHTNASLTVEGSTFNVANNLDVYGTLNANNTSGSITVNGNVTWHANSTADFTAFTYFNVYGDWVFNDGANVNLAKGVVQFWGSTDKYILSNSSTCSFNHVACYKSGGAKLGISYNSTQPLTINGDIYVESGAIFGIYSTKDVKLKGSLFSDGSFICNFGTVVLNGDVQTLQMNVDDYFNNLTFNESGYVILDPSLSDVLNVRKNVVISSGFFGLQNNIMKVGGNWTNTVGPDGFWAGSSRVIFNSTGYNYVKTSETFNILEANMGTALRVDNASSVVTCNQYDWTTGGIDVMAGTFTALDLYDNGIFGNYWVKPGGTINLTNDGWVDLSANLNITGGYFNVYGGTTDSYWPYGGDASINMTGGVLDFKNTGIYITAFSGYTFTENITGGVIRTVGDFNNQRTDFTPEACTVELYGSTNALLTTGAGCSVVNVVVNKGADEDAPPTPLFDREGKPIEQTRASTVLAGSNPLTILGDLTVDAGTFDLNTRTVNVAGDVNINSATLKMVSPTDNLTADYIGWYPGSNSNVTNGEFHVNDWRFQNGTNAKLGIGNTTYLKSMYYPTDADAEFGNLVVLPWSKTISNQKETFYPIRVAGNFTMQSEAGWVGLYTDLIVTGNANIQDGASISFNNGTEMLCNGSLTLAGSLSLISLSGATVHGDFVFPNTGTLSVGVGAFTNSFGSGMALLSGKLTLTSGIVSFPNRSVKISSTFDNQIGAGTFRIGKSLIASSPGTFELNGGTVEFINASSGNYVEVTNGNYLYNMVLNKPGSILIVQDNLTLKGAMTIDDGTLYANDKTISIAGHWLNNVGTSGFMESTSRVIFNGTLQQWCSSEDFYILEIDKPDDLFNVPEATITCQIYDWKSGGLWISPGNFSAADLANDGLFGKFVIFGGTMDLHQDAGQYVDINGEIIIGYDATLNVYGGDGDSWWSYRGDASITMAHPTSVLDFKDVGINVSNSPTYTFTENITNGTIRTVGCFDVNNPAFTPSGGTIELYGNTTAVVENVVGSNFHNLTINKSGATDEGSEPLTIQDRDGKTKTLSLGNLIILGSDILINGALTVNAGELNLNFLGYDITCMGPASIENGAMLLMSAASQLKLNTSLTVKNGGTFVTQGGSGLETRVTRAATNRYLFDVESGGTIYANNTLFEYMGANGINIASGAEVYPATAFNNCTFQQGLSGGTLLTMNSAQTLECTGAIFPANTWGGTNNVKKTNNAGRITFIDYSGDFAGAAYESDPNNRIDWFTAGLSASPLTLNVDPPAGTAIINVTSNLAWTATESSPWFSISPTSGTNNGTITVTYDKNSSASGRSGTITISAPSVSDVVVTVNQAGATLAVTPASQSVTAPAGTTTFSVASNTTWTVTESVSWLSVSPMSGTANGTLTVTYDQNTSTTPRTGQITVTVAGLTPVVIMVSQAGAGATLTVTPTNRLVVSPAGTTTFSIASNTGWVVTESVAWFTVAPMSGSGNGTLTVNYTQNNTGSPRVGNILLTATGGAPVVTVSVSQSAYHSQDISLSAGWQGLSSYVMPADNNIENVFAPLAPKLIIAQTQSGIYYPAGPINTIGTWMSQSAYAVKMNSAATLSIYGLPETDKTYDLVTGWNLIPVIANNPVNVAALPTTVGFQMVKEVAGTGVYWPAYSINTLGNLLPGKAYYVRVTSGGTITFPGNTDAGWDGEYPETQLLETPWTQPEAAPVSHLVAFVPGATAELRAGDIVGLFTPENICCGVAQVEMPGEPLAITAFADDAQQPGTSGYLSGQTISLKLYRPATNEVGMLTAVYEISGDGSIFADHGLSVITHIQQTATGITPASSVAVEIYPNPTGGNITITGIGHYSLLQLYSVHGELLMQRTNDAASELSWDVSAVPPGVYQLKLSGNHPTVVKKLIRK
jgi:hypothetical protein